MSDTGDPILVMHDDRSEGVWAMCVKRKGNYGDYVVKRIADVISRLGYARIVLKSDQEPSIKDVMCEAKKRVGQIWRSSKKVCKIKRPTEWKFRLCIHQLGSRKRTG